MPVKEQYDFDEVLCIPTFSFNSTATRLALSPNNELVNIYALKKGKWELETILKEHTERVTGIDWGKNNKILTCAADRNAYVWTEEKPKEWKQSLVLLRIDRAALNAKWAPMENKFAIGTGSKLICVCFYEEANDWWISKHIRKPFKSSVLCIAWHPSNSVIAAGSSDFRVRVFSAGIKEIEKKPETTNWGSKLAFGALLAEFPSKYGGWVHSICFSLNGEKLAWVSHDSTISIADSSKNPFLVFVQKLTTLPLLTCLFLDDKTILAAGHDNCPYKFVWDGSNLSSGEDIDTKVAKKQVCEESAMSRFRNLDKIAQSGAVSTTTTNKTHKNSILCMVRLSNGNIASSALDNKIAVWS